MAIEDDITTELRVARGGAKLSQALITIIVKYLVNVVKVEEVDEVAMGSLDKIATDAWLDQEQEEIPGMRLEEVKNWVAGVAPKGLSSLSSVKAAPAVVGTFELGSSLDEEESRLFGDAGATARETAQLRKDSEEQDLSGTRMLVLSLALELGRVPPASDVLGEVRWGTVMALSKMAKEQRKAGLPTMKTILEAAEPVRHLNMHLTAVIREYSARGQTVEASLITSWWTEVQSVASSPKMMVEYISEYMRKYSGRGLPCTVDVLIATRCASVSGAAGGASAETLKELKEAAKVARAEAKEVKSELNALKAEVSRQKERLRQLEGGEPRGAAAAARAERLSRVKCWKCGLTGHLAKDCPNGEKNDSKGDDEE